MSEHAWQCVFLVKDSHRPGNGSSHKLACGGCWEGLRFSELAMDCKAPLLQLKQLKGEMLVPEPHYPLLCWMLCIKPSLLANPTFANTCTKWAPNTCSFNSYIIELRNLPYYVSPVMLHVEDLLNPLLTPRCKVNRADSQTQQASYSLITWKIH